jgi:versiconal hemiacetal acetate esterase
MSYKKSWLDLEEALGGRSTIAGTPAEIKARSLVLKAYLERSIPKQADTVRITHGEVEGVRYRMYRPAETERPPKPLPVGIWAHGGGWMTGDLDNDDRFCRIVAENILSVVISVDYRLTPDHPMPTQLNDCLKIYRWVIITVHRCSLSDLWYLTPHPGL